MIETRAELLKQDHAGVEAHLLLGIQVVPPSLELVP